MNTDITLLKAGRFPYRTSLAELESWGCSFRGYPPASGFYTHILDQNPWDLWFGKCEGGFDYA